MLLPHAHLIRQPNINRSHFDVEVLLPVLPLPDLDRVFVQLQLHQGLLDEPAGLHQRLLRTGRDASKDVGRIGRIGAAHVAGDVAAHFSGREISLPAADHGLGFSIVGVDKQANTISVSNILG